MDRRACRYPHPELFVELPRERDQLGLARLHKPTGQVPHARVRALVWSTVREEDPATVDQCPEDDLVHARIRARASDTEGHADPRAHARICRDKGLDLPCVAQSVSPTMSSTWLASRIVMEIERLIRAWAEAAHSGDLDAVVFGHDDDIVMFDVPPPHDGVRGLRAYRDTWPGFFDWQASGASFDIVELEVTEGQDVAFAWALLKCGTSEGFAQEPDRRLRLTVGLRKKGDEWWVVHEHHSFADTSSTPV